MQWKWFSTYLDAIYITGFMFLHKDLSKIMLQFNYVFNTFTFKVTLASPLSSTYFLNFCFIYWLKLHFACLYMFLYYISISPLARIFISLLLLFFFYVSFTKFFLQFEGPYSMWTYFVLPVSVLLFYDLLPYWCMRPYVVLSL